MYKHISVRLVVNIILIVLKQFITRVHLKGPVTVSRRGIAVLP